MKKKILFLITTLNGGGAEKVLVDIVNSLPAEEFDITLQTIFNSGVHLSNIGVNVKYKTIINNSRSILGWIKSKFIYHLFTPKYIYNRFVKDKDNYDIEVAFLEGMPTRIIAYSTNQNAKKYAWVHTDLMSFFGSVNNYKNFSENKLCYKKFDKIACVSESVKEKFIERFGDLGSKLQVVYNIIDDKSIKQSAEEKIDVFKHDYPIMISCGRLCEQKGFDRLLHIHKRLLDDGIMNYLWIVGEGSLRQQFEEYIKKNNLESTVTLWGFQSNPYKFMKNADLFVCSSIAEGYSLVATESVLLNVPVVSTNVAGLLEPYDAPRCYKVVENDEESLFRATKDLLTNKLEFEKAKEYTQKISSYFIKERYLEELLKFLGE